ncbi:MAG: AAA family ATPase [Nitrospirae bacterium]|nr:AAA family ATPase [Nitrospirota bacterium]
MTIAEQLQTVYDSPDTNSFTSDDIQKMFPTIRISATVSSRIVARYKDKTKSILTNKPYQLIRDINGVGFTTADAIARAVGYKIAGQDRIEAGIRHVLTEGAQTSGCTCMPYGYLVVSVQKLLGVQDVLIMSVVDHMISRGSLISKDTSVALKKYYNLEESIANELRRIINSESKLIASLINDDNLQDDQRQALRKIVDSKVFVLTGPPGTGKTYTIKRIIEMFKTDKIALTAPTGKAAKRMFEQTDVDACTIHRLLGASKFDGVFAFTYNRENKLDVNLIIVDESSMIDVFLMSSLLEAIPDTTRLILVGDSYQLPSVGPGNILKDIIASGVIPTVELTIIKRQDEGLIIRNCHKIKDGYNINLENSTAKDFFFLMRDTEEEIQETVLGLYDRLKRPISDVQILSPFKSRTGLSCEKFNALYQDKVNARPLHKTMPYKIGDKVIQTKNNYDIGVFNGDIGFIKKIDYGRLRIRFENPLREVSVPASEVQLAYAITIHKSQGSEWPVVIIPVHISFGGFLMNRNMLYTAISRAKEICILVGHKNEVAKIIKRNKVQKRYTNLEVLLKQKGDNKQWIN